PSLEASRNHDQGISLLCDQETERAQEIAGKRVLAIVANNAFEVVSSKCDHKRYALGERQQTALPPLRVDQIVGLAADLFPNLTPCPQIVGGILRTPKVKNINVKV